MAITVVPSSPIVPVSPARVPALNTPREQTPVVLPSAITRISPEGKLRAELDQRQTTAAAQNEEDLASRASAAPRRTAIEEAPVAAEVAALAVQVPSPSLTPRPVRNAEPVTPPVTEAVAPTRRNPQPKLEAPPQAESSVPTPSVPPVAPQRVRQAASAVPAEERAIPATITRTANDLVAAFNALQASRSQTQASAAPVAQTQVANTADVRNTAPPNVRNNTAAVETTPRRAEVASARFDASTFTVALARDNNVPVQRPSAGDAVTVLARDDANDTARVARTVVARVEPSQVQQGAVASSVRQGEQQVVAAPSFSNQGAQQVANPVANQGGNASVAPSGLAKHLNDRANLLTP